MYSPIQDVDDFVYSSEQIWRNVALHHLLTNRSSVSSGFVSYKHAAFDINQMLLVDYSDVFISCLNSHSDGTHSLQSIH